MSMVSPTGVNMTTFPYTITPIADIAPFSYQAGLTYQEVLTSLRDWLTNVLVPYVNTYATNDINAYNAAQQVLATAMDNFNTTAAADIANIQQIQIDVNNALSAANTDATNASASATSASTSETNAAASATSAANSASAASASAASMVTAQDTQVASLMGNGNSLPVNETNTALVNAIRIWTRSTLLNARWGFMGDSITNSALTWPAFEYQYWSIASGRNTKFWPAIMAGVSGDTTTGMLNRIATDFPSGSIDVGMILGGTNDVGAGFALSTTQSNIMQMVDYIHSIGALCILATIPPRAQTAAVDAVNAWIKEYGKLNNIPVVDFHSVLADPATDLYYPNLTTDGVHPTPAGHSLMANVMNQTIDTFLSGQLPEVVASNNTDARNNVVNGFFDAWNALPAFPTVTIADAGGAGSALTAGTYYYKVAYVSQFGESLPSPELSVTIAAGESVAITIPAWYVNCIAYRIYRGTASGSETFLAEVVANPNASQTFTDGGAETPTAAVPQTADYFAGPEQWSSGAGTGTLQVAKAVDADFIGTPVDVSGRTGVTADLTTSQPFPVAPAANDIIAISFKVKTTGVNSVANFAAVRLRDANNNVLMSAQYNALTNDSLATVARYYVELACPANVTQITVDFQTDTSGHAYRVGDVSVINLTKLGLR